MNWSRAAARVVRAVLLHGLETLAGLIRLVHRTAVMFAAAAATGWKLCAGAGK